MHDGRGEGSHSTIGGGAEEVRDDAEVGRQRVGTDKNTWCTVGGSQQSVLG